MHKMSYKCLIFWNIHRSMRHHLNSAIILSGSSLTKTAEIINTVSKWCLPQLNMLRPEPETRCNKLVIAAR